MSTTPIPQPRYAYVSKILSTPAEMGDDFMMLILHESTGVSYVCTLHVNEGMIKEAIGGSLEMDYNPDPYAKPTYTWEQAQINELTKRECLMIANLYQKKAEKVHRLKTYISGNRKKVSKHIRFELKHRIRKMAVKNLLNEFAKDLERVNQVKSEVESRIRTLNHILSSINK